MATQRTWRTTYSPGSWMVLNGPKALVAAQPTTAESAGALASVWSDVVAATDLESLVSRLINWGLDVVPDLIVVVDAGMLQCVVRGSVVVKDAATGDVVADGRSQAAWRSANLQTQHVTVKLSGGDAMDWRLPLAVGVVAASSLDIDARDGARIDIGEGLVFPVEQDLKAAAAAVAAPVVAAPVVAAPVVEPVALPVAGETPADPSTAPVEPVVAVIEEPVAESAIEIVAEPEPAPVVQPVETPAAEPAEDDAWASLPPPESVPAEASTAETPAVVEQPVAVPPLAAPIIPPVVEPAPVVELVETPVVVPAPVVEQPVVEPVETPVVPEPAPVAEPVEAPVVPEPAPVVPEPVVVAPEPVPVVVPEPVAVPAPVVAPVETPVVPEPAPFVPAFVPSEPIAVPQPVVEPVETPVVYEESTPIAPESLDQDGRFVREFVATENIPVPQPTPVPVTPEPAPVAAWPTPEPEPVQPAPAPVAAQPQPDRVEWWQAGPEPAPAPVPAPAPAPAPMPAPVPAPEPVAVPVEQPVASVAAAQTGSPTGATVLVFSDGQRWPVSEPLLVGRAPQAYPGETAQLVRVVSEHHDISRTHVRIELYDGAMWATDRESTNGTIVQNPNQEPITAHPGEPVHVWVGGVIDIGDGVTIRVE